VLIIKKKGVIYLIILIFIPILGFCGTSIVSRNNKDVDIYNTIKEAFLTDEGYSNELSKYISEEVFKRTNIYSVYRLNSRSEYKKPFKVDFRLKEDSQKVNKDIVYVKMTYSVAITDSQNKDVGGSWNIPITFTVKKTGNQWYIIDKYEPA